MLQREGGTLLGTDGKHTWEQREKATCFPEEKEKAVKVVG